MRQVNLPPMQVRSMENPREVVGEAKEVPNYYCCYCYVWINAQGIRAIMPQHNSSSNNN